MVGPHLVASSLMSEKAAGIGLNLGLRARLRVSERVEPYLFVGSGIMVWDERPGIQATDWGFIIQGGPGVRLWLSDRLAVTAGYRVWHQSNGSSVFFDGTKSPNPGYNADAVFLGVEYFLD